MTQVGLLLAAMQALTRVPVAAPHGPDVLRRASRYFPLVGVGVGLVGWGVLEAARAGLPGEVAAVLSLAATLALTGALHEDGLADSADGLLGGRTRDDALRIMRDSRLGTYGVLALVLALGAKLGLVAALPSGLAVGAAFVAGHAVGRFWMMALPLALPYARPDCMAAAVARPGAAEWGVALLVAVPALALLGPRAGGALVLSGGVAVAMGWCARRRLGGYTGDVLGATMVLTELAVLLAAAWRPV